MLPALKNNAAAGYKGPVKRELLKGEGLLYQKAVLLRKLFFFGNYFMGDDCEIMKNNWLLQSKLQGINCFQKKKKTCFEFSVGSIPYTLCYLVAEETNLHLLSQENALFLIYCR